MNKTLEIQGEFQSLPNTNKGKPHLPELNDSEEVTIEDLIKFENQLEYIKLKFIEFGLEDDIMLSVRFKRVISKSKRISSFFGNSIEECNNYVVGVKFDETLLEKRIHVITYHINLEKINKSIDKLKKCKTILHEYFNNKVNGSGLKYNLNKVDFKSIGISKTQFINMIVNSYFIYEFFIDNYKKNTSNSMIVSFYKTNMHLTNILKRLKIDKLKFDFLDENTVLLNEEEVEIVFKNYPYLISMATINFTDYSFEESNRLNEQLFIPKPANEPVIGVIDTLFDEECYFKDWVEYVDLVSNDINKTSKDKEHGTSVSSIIVDGPSINPALDDGCGRFRVKHFGVATAGITSSFSIIKKIEEIVLQNLDIKVWNLSLGSKEEINDYFISPEAYVLDQLQSKYDIIFVIAGTNDKHCTLKKKIGAPADSLNSIVVNATTSDEVVASYSRKGPVLSFFVKPDVSVFGGDKDERMRVCNGFTASNNVGTSFAAPWITRKIAYLIYILKLQKEVAKALIIDSAVSWNSNSNLELKGYGNVAIHIDEIIKTKGNEIKFCFYQVAELYETSTFKLPIPLVDGTFPFIAKATLCYFPPCTRNQGIDYTDLELSLSFGRTQTNNKIKKINPITNENYLTEDDLRKLQRKWDNVKVVIDETNAKPKPRKSYTDFWGIQVKKANRHSSKTEQKISFGIVVTLKEINGVNRITEFIKNFTNKTWFVRQLDSVEFNNIYLKSEEDIQFE